MSRDIRDEGSHDLTANRSGFLSNRQRRVLTLQSFGNTVVLLAILILVWLIPSPLSYQPIRIIMIVIGMIFAYDVILLWLDVVSRKTVSAKGRFRKSLERTPKGFYNYFLSQNQLRLSITEQVYKGFEENAVYQVFYLPYTKRVILLYRLDSNSAESIKSMKAL